MSSIYGQLFLTTCFAHLYRVPDESTILSPAPRHDDTLARLARSPLLND